MTVYQLVLTVKFLGAMGYAGGLIASFVAAEPLERKRAVHSIASPSLLATWCAGYALAALGGLRLFELWVVGGLALSVGSNVVLVYCVSRGKRGTLAFSCAALPLACVVGLMVFKPTWSQVLK
ncbi:hypothetical protein WME89_21665 [Sorangium sp. So ce321]|uniref:hypothetical protein n=1 Tax=Sorangium sp. So ce321 TaxID=3133300 RepID=UPI003F601763